MMNFFDIPVFNMINHGLSCNFLNIFMPLVAHLGSGELLFVVALLLLFSRKKETKMLALLLIAGLTVSFYAATILKMMVARPRPFIALTNVVLLGSEKTVSFSFPSNHAVMVFMAAMLLSNRFKRSIFFYLLAVVVGISRVYMGLHYPTDVIGGALIGLAIGFFLITTAKRIGIMIRE